MTEDEKRDALLAALTEAYNALGAQHTVLIGLVRALIVERAEDDPEATQRLVETVESAFALDEAQRQFFARHDVDAHRCR